MAVNHLESVLTTAGLPADQVKALLGLKEDDQEFKPDQYVGTLRTNVEQQVVNDPKFYEGLTVEGLTKNAPNLLKTLEANQYGRAANILRSNVLKAVGMKEDDFKDLGDEGKKIEIFAPAFAKKLSEGKVTDKELQTKLMEATTQLEDLKKQQPELEQKYQSQADQTVADRTFNMIVLAQIAQVQGLKAPAKYVYKDVAAQLKNLYGFAITGDGLDAELRQKDKPDLKVLTKDNTKPLTLSDAIQAILVQDELVDTKKSTTKINGTVDVKTDQQTGLKVSGNVNKKIQDRIAQDSKAAGAK